MSTKKTFSQKLGNKIKVCRAENGLSQPDLAKKLGYGSSTAISLIENGNRSLKIEDLVKLSKLFKKDYSYFLDGSADTVKKKDTEENVEDLARRLIRMSRNKRK